MLERCEFSFLTAPDDVFLGVGVDVVPWADPPSAFLLEGVGMCVDIVWLRLWDFDAPEAVVELEWLCGVAMKGPEIVGWPLDGLEKAGEPIDPGPCVETVNLDPSDGATVEDPTGVVEDEDEDEEERPIGGMPKGETREEVTRVGVGVGVRGGLADEGKKVVAGATLLDRRAYSTEGDF